MISGSSFFCQKYVNKKLAAFLGFPRNQKAIKSRSAQFQNLIFNERRTFFSPLKYINFILLVNLNFFFSKTLHLKSFSIQLLLFSPILKNYVKSVTDFDANFEIDENSNNCIENDFNNICPTIQQLILIPRFHVGTNLVPW